MDSKTAFLHIFMPCILAILYVYFIVFLVTLCKYKNHIIWLTFLLIGIFFLFFILYGLAAYGVLHKGPGYQNYQNTKKKLDVDEIGQYKENSRKIYQLEEQMKEDITYQRLKTLQMQYISRYEKSSFCDNCEIVQKPRTYHCQRCDKCILRRQKHSQLTNMCIGQKNMKIYMQYMFIAMFLTFFMMVSLILITVLEHHKLKDFTDFQLLMFAFLQMALGCACALFGRQFFISYRNAIDNITQTQRKKKIINKKNNPFKKQHYYEQLFRSRLEYLKVNEIAQPGQWLQMQQEFH